MISQLLYKIAAELYNDSTLTVQQRPRRVVILFDFFFLRGEGGQGDLEGLLEWKGLGRERGRMKEEGYGAKTNTRVAN